ncbi:hypothetical protein FRC07_007888, partial [Ceratobasidium sp. 392]
MHSYTDDPPTYEVAIGKLPGKTDQKSPAAAVQLSQTKNGSHLALFQALADDVRK